MSSSISFRPISKALCSIGRRYSSDRRGVAAVEFALIVPLLLIMYFLTLETGYGIETNKKVGRIAAIVGDLVTQQPKTTKADLEAISRIGQAVVQPYRRSKPGIYIAGIQIGPAPAKTATVVWEAKIEKETGVFSSSKPANKTVTVPPSLNTADTFLVQVVSELDYKPLIAWTAAQQSSLGFTSPYIGMSMAETYYNRSRMSPTVECTNC